MVCDASANALVAFIPLATIAPETMEWNDSPVFH
jgi:hypothetical protein